MKKITKWHTYSLLLLTSTLFNPTTVRASGPDDAKGLWMTDVKDAVIRFDNCSDRPGALCGTIVWDIDAGTPADTCGERVIQLDNYTDEAWRDGWVYDPREDKTYKGKVSVEGAEMSIRAFIGFTVLGKTEHLARTDQLPASPSCKQ
ncbi:DUF2147 domain-containing protein [Amphritea pacifica]|uniref:DUF2147 domain-containing protein n=1 Tax=Amphritea pacifica TaxID=2811233 RepID=A0ABS2W7D8_9GAMM|nr:DUF2147 domain-containing protein [Amphritea pacifica]MBN0987646.1 DUF2147 domain-containing protein [Amphritea pacifica]MBN1009060.1 DUF2147 domain-containing protein [Amphritea pacifica]